MNAKNTTLIKTEAMLPLLFFVLFTLYYGVFTSIAAKHPGVDYSHYLATPLDQTIPLIPYFVIPYLLISTLNPFFTVYVLVRMHGFDRDLFRRFYVCLFLSLIPVFMIWYFFPTDYRDYSPYLLTHPTALHSSFWGNDVVLAHIIAPPWNSFPSSHVIFPWYFFRVMQRHAKKAAWLFFLLSVLISCSTLFIKIHYIADVVSGYIIAEIAYRFFVRAEERKWLSTISEKKMLTLYISMLIALSLGLIPAGLKGLVVL